VGGGECREAPPNPAQIDTSIVLKVFKLAHNFASEYSAMLIGQIVQQRRVDERLEKNREASLLRSDGVVLVY
jgi:hypothetical protein